MKTRIVLPVVCAHFRWTRTKYGCSIHDRCDHTANFAACADFIGVKRASSPAAAVEDEFAEHCPCAAKPQSKPTK